jgi:hypothetical protein
VPARQQRLAVQAGTSPRVCNTDGMSACKIATTAHARERNRDGRLARFTAMQPTPSCIGHCDETHLEQGQGPCVRSCPAACCFSRSQTSTARKAAANREWHSRPNMRQKKRVSTRAVLAPPCMAVLPRLAGPFELISPYFN